MYNFMTGRDDEEKLLTSLDAAGSPLDLLDPGPAAPAATPGDANGNGVPDVMERTTTIKEKFAPRQAGGQRSEVGGQPKPWADMAATMPNGDMLIGGQGRVASFSPQEQVDTAKLPGGFNAYARRFMPEGNALDRERMGRPNTLQPLHTPEQIQARRVDNGMVQAFQMRGVGDSLMSDQHMEDLGKLGMPTSAQDRLAWAGRGDRHNVARYRMMQEQGAARAEAGRQFDAGLESATDQTRIKADADVRAARATGRYKFMGDQANAQAQLGAALLGRRDQPEADPFRTVGNRLVDVRSGTEVAPQQKPDAGKAGLAESQVPGVYFFTDPAGDVKVHDLRERQNAGKWDIMQYNLLMAKDPAAAEDMLRGRGAYAPAAAGATAGAGRVTAAGEATVNQPAPFAQEGSTDPARKAKLAEEWARAHPDDPRAQAVFRKLGLQ